MLCVFDSSMQKTRKWWVWRIKVIWSCNYWFYVVHVLAQWKNEWKSYSLCLLVIVCYLDMDSSLHQQNLFQIVAKIRIQKVKYLLNNQKHKPKYGKNDENFLSNQLHVKWHSILIVKSILCMSFSFTCNSYKSCNIFTKGSNFSINCLLKI